MTPSTPPLLAGLKILECSLLGGAAISTPLADLGADVIKVEPPGGDYVRDMTWPLIDGVSLLHLHLNRGKRSIVLNLKDAADVTTFLTLASASDVVIEAMRPGGLERRGLSYERLQQANPQLVFCSFTGYGNTGPYRNLPSHGIAFDAWAAVFAPDRTDDGYPCIPEHLSVGMNAGALYGALGILAGVLQARATGKGCRLDIAQADAAAAMNWLRIETVKAYERPATEVTGNTADSSVRRPPGTAGMRDSVRYQIYDSRDGAVLFMASEQKFWRNFCQANTRMDLYATWPGAKYADHATGNSQLRHQLALIFKTRTTPEWITHSLEHDYPLAPVNNITGLLQDPQFTQRLPWLDTETLGTPQLPSPIRSLHNETGHLPSKAPTIGQHSDEIR